MAYFDSAYFDAAYFDAATGGWIVLPPSNGAWTEQPVEESEYTEL
jgi:hypothetical protein